MVYLTRREQFSAAHKLSREDWSSEKNSKVFGKCANPNWHGHNYELFVTVKGNIDVQTGFVIDLRLLSKLIKERVISQLDHKNVNLDTRFMLGKMASAENIAIAIWNELYKPVEEMGCTLHCVKLVETENNFIEYLG